MAVVLEGNAGHPVLVEDAGNAGRGDVDLMVALEERAQPEAPALPFLSEPEDQGRDAGQRSVALRPAAPGPVPEARQVRLAMPVQPDVKLEQGPPAEMEKVTIGIINFNGRNTLPQTLQSIQNLRYPAFTLLVVDNYSTDGSREWVQQYCPDIECICLDSNLGLPGARNVVLQHAQTDYVFIVDNDIIVEPDALFHLMQVIKKVPRAAACHAEMRDPKDPMLACHYNGGWIHYLCALVPRKSYCAERCEYEAFDVVSGGALLIDRRAALRIGGFDEDYFFNWEDTDFTSRFTLAGYVCLNVPRAVAYHHTKPRGKATTFYQVRNRWFFILKLYSWRTLVLAAPIFIVFELFQALLLLMHGSAREYLDGSLAAARQLPRILRKRAAFQRLKVKRDRDWLRGEEFYVPERLLIQRPLRLLKAVSCDFFGLYWRLIRPFC